MSVDELCVLTVVFVLFRSPLQYIFHLIVLTSETFILSGPISFIICTVPVKGLLVVSVFNAEVTKL